jgi:predicted TPR repeat methyltransferase
MPACCECEAIDRHFAASRAAKELDIYLRRGPTGTARLILRALHELPGPVESVLDIGAGIGVLHHELVGTGTRSAVHVEVARAYVDAARRESERRGHAERVTFLHGDFLALGPSVDSADLVTLDRVVCCYAALEPLVTLSAGKARRYYALSFPHDRWYVRAHTRWQNHRRKRSGNPFRTFVHPTSVIRSLVLAAGFEIRRTRRTLVWEILVCIRRDVT